MVDVEEADLVLPREVAGRLHAYGDQEVLYDELADRFSSSCDAGSFESWERDWIDPETGKIYHTYLKLCVEELRPGSVPQDVCPECGEALADATDIPDDSICDSCSWSRSGIRRCIRCGTKDESLLLEGDAVCRRCRT